MSPELGQLVYYYDAWGPAKGVVSHNSDDLTIEVSRKYSTGDSIESVMRDKVFSTPVEAAKACIKSAKETIEYCKMVAGGKITI